MCNNSRLYWQKPKLYIAANLQAAQHAQRRDDIAELEKRLQEYG